MKTCADIQLLLAGHVDNELDPVHSLEVARHLEGCADCSRDYQAQLALVEALCAAPRYSAPAGLRSSIDRALRTAASPPARRGVRFGEFVSVRWQAFVEGLTALTGLRSGWGQAVALAGAVILLGGIVTLTWTSARWSALGSERDLVAGEAISSHIRSLMASHLADVVSTDRHTVKPWFTGKLDFSPPVVDLTAESFPLTGGRLDYLDGRPAAALVYRRNQHIINLFVQPLLRTAAGPLTRSEALMQRGYHLRHWTQGGMSYWAVSDLNEDKLTEFTKLVQQETPN